MSNINKKLVIIGGEGNGGVIASCVEENRHRYNNHEWEIAGFVNDYETEVSGYPVLAKLSNIHDLYDNSEYFFMWAIHMIGRNILSYELWKKAKVPFERMPIIIHETASVSPSAKLAPGTFIMSNAYIGPNVELGVASLVMANALIGHNTKVASHCHFSVGSITSSYVEIGTCSDVTLGARVLEKRKIGNFAVAGAASLVTKDIPDYEIHIGSPAKFYKKVKTN